MLSIQSWDTGHFRAPDFIGDAQILTTPTPKVSK